MSHKRKALVLAGVVVLLLSVGVSQLQAQSPLTLRGLSERISELARAVSTLRSTSATMSEVIALENRIATVEARLAEPPHRHAGGRTLYARFRAACIRPNAPYISHVVV